jgi:UDP-N-acetylglucosamine--N-acetylmuramyl-(pentapeptide) pyrophosphoryl-undecaprenol N-acetylglucosamine transferase
VQAYQVAAECGVLQRGFRLFTRRLCRLVASNSAGNAHPGRTNSLLAAHARLIGTGAPLEYYRYPAAKARYVGIPVKPEFHPYNQVEKAKTKHLFHLPDDRPLLVVTGGGLGAKRINDAMVLIGPELLKHLSVVHLCGTRQYDELKNKVPISDNYKLIAFLSDHVARLIGAADIVVARAGASAMAELAAVGTSVIMVPNGRLAGGHQLKNAKVYIDAHAALEADETQFKDDPQLLCAQILQLLGDGALRRRLGEALHEFAKPDAAKDVALLIEQAAGW